MNFEEIIKAVGEHNITYPDHKTDCACMDLYAVQLNQIIAEQDRKVGNRLRIILRLALVWDAARNNPVTGPLPKITD